MAEWASGRRRAMRARALGKRGALCWRPAEKCGPSVPLSAGRAQCTCTIAIEFSLLYLSLSLLITRRRRRLRHLPSLSRSFANWSRSIRARHPFRPDFERAFSSVCSFRFQSTLSQSDAPRSLIAKSAALLRSNLAPFFSRAPFSSLPRRPCVMCVVRRRWVVRGGAGGAVHH